MTAQAQIFELEEKKVRLPSPLSSVFEDTVRSFETNRVGQPTDSRLVDPVYLAKIRGNIARESAAVAAFLQPLDPKDAFLKALALALEAIKTNSDLRQAADATIQWMGNAFPPEIARAFRMIKRPDTTARNSFLEVAYLRCLEEFRPDPEKALETVRSALSHPSEIVSRINAGIGNTPPKFVGQLVVETEIRAAQSPDLANRLRLAWEELESATQLAILVLVAPQQDGVLLRYNLKENNGNDGGGVGISVSGSCSTADSGTACAVIAGVVTVLAILCAFFC